MEHALNAQKHAKMDIVMKIPVSVTCTTPILNAAHINATCSKPSVMVQEVVSWIINVSVTIPTTFLMENNVQNCFVKT